MDGKKQGTLTVSELAGYLNVGTTVAYRLVKEPGFPAVRITPKKIVIPVAALEKWLAEKAEQNGGERDE